MIIRIRKYARIWWQMVVISFKVQTAYPLASFGYLMGKLIRLGFFWIFMDSLFQHTDHLADYNRDQTLLFFLTFNWVDVVAQLIFRGIYAIRGLIREGDYDYFLIQPTAVLFRVAFSTVDFLDVVTMIPISYLTIKLLGSLGLLGDWAALARYGILFWNGILIAFAIHLAVASMAVWTQELDNTIWLYRDIMTLGRYPSTVYPPWLQVFLTWVLPIVVMMGFPVKALLGELNWFSYAIAAGISILTLLASYFFWISANKRYTSLSS